MHNIHCSFVMNIFLFSDMILMMATLSSGHFTFAHKYFIILLSAVIKKGTVTTMCTGCSTNKWYQRHYFWSNPQILIQCHKNLVLNQFSQEIVQYFHLQDTSYVQQMPLHTQYVDGKNCWIQMLNYATHYSQIMNKHRSNYSWNMADTYSKCSLQSKTAKSKLRLLHWRKEINKQMNTYLFHRLYRQDIIYFQHSILFWGSYSKLDFQCLITDRLMSLPIFSLTHQLCILLTHY
jgi:hypothetical protein